MGRIGWAVTVALLMACGSVLYIYLAIDEPVRAPAVQRAQSQDMLDRHAAALGRYRTAHEGAWPKDLLKLYQFSRAQEDPTLHLEFGDWAVPGGGIYRYRPPQADGDVVMASDKAHRVVAAGEQWTVDGAPARDDHPAVYFVLGDDLQVRKLSPDAHRRAVPWLYDEQAEGR
jgi:hypothetical protein